MLVLRFRDPWATGLTTLGVMTLSLGLAWVIGFAQGKRLKAVVIDRSVRASTKGVPYKYALMARLDAKKPAYKYK